MLSLKRLWKKVKLIMYFYLIQFIYINMLINYMKLLKILKII